MSLKVHDHYDFRRYTQVRILWALPRVWIVTQWLGINLRHLLDHWSRFMQRHRSWADEIWIYPVWDHHTSFHAGSMNRIVLSRPRRAFYIRHRPQTRSGPLRSLFLVWNAQNVVFSALFAPVLGHTIESRSFPIGEAITILDTALIKRARWNSSWLRRIRILCMELSSLGCLRVIKIFFDMQEKWIWWR